MPPCLSVTQISRFFGNHMKNGTAAAIGARLHILFLRQAIQAAKSWGQGKRVAVPRKCLFWWIRKTLCNGCAAALGEGTCREQGGAGQGEDARSSAGTRRKGDPARSLKWVFGGYKKCSFLCSKWGKEWGWGYIKTETKEKPAWRRNERGGGRQTITENQRRPMAK